MCNFPMNFRPSVGWLFVRRSASHNFLKEGKFKLRSTCYHVYYHLQIKIWFQNHRYKTKKAIHEKGYEGWPPGAFGPRRLALPMMIRGDGLAAAAGYHGGLSSKQEALLAQVYCLL